MAKMCVSVCMVRRDSQWAMSDQGKGHIISQPQTVKSDISALAQYRQL